MSSPRKIQNIALIGFMGTGKSSVGRLVADMLRFDYLDTDDLIEKLAGKSIARLFEEDGEPAFRKREREVIEALRKRQGAVIATGGGAGANEANLTSLKQHALVVCLWASPQIIWNRVRNQTHRPLLRGADPEEKIRELLALREPFYREADVLLNTEVRSPKEVAQHVVHEFHYATRSR